MIDMNGKYILKILSYLLMVIALVIFFLFLILDISIFKPSYVTNRFKKDNYYEIVFNNIKENFSKELSNVNIDDSIIQDVITIDIVKEDIDNYVKSFYKKDAFILHSLEIEEDMDLKINKYLTDNKIIIESKKEISLALDNMIKSYEDGVTSSNYLNDISSNFYTIRNSSTFIMIITIITALVTYLLLLFIFKVKPLGKVFMATSTIIILFELYMQGKVVRFSFNNQYIIAIYKNIYNDILMKMLLVGILLFIAGLIFFIFERLFKKN